MTKPQIVKDYESFMDEYGLVQPDHKDEKRPPSQNGTLFTAQYIVALNHHKALQFEIARLHKLYLSCESLPGLLTRTPAGTLRAKEQEGPDNHYAAIYVDMVLHTGFSKRFLEYGKTAKITKYSADNKPSKMEAAKWEKYTKWGYRILKVLGLGNPKKVYNAEKPDTFTLDAYFGRFPQMFGLAKMVAGKWLNPIEWCGIAVSLLIAAYSEKNNQDKWTLAHMKILVAEKKSFIMRHTVCRLWRKKFKKHYPEGFGEVLSNYFNRPANGLPEHPHAKWMKNVF